MPRLEKVSIMKKTISAMFVESRRDTTGVETMCCAMTGEKRKDWAPTSSKCMSTRRLKREISNAHKGRIVVNSRMI